MKRYTFLVIIGTDELPPKFLKKLGKDFFNYVKNEFKKNNIFYDSMSWFATPRHLAVKSKFCEIKKKDNVVFSKSYVCDKNQIITCNMEDTKKCTNNFFKKKLSITDRLLYVSQEQFLYNEDVLCITDIKYLLCIIMNNVLKKFINYEMMRWSNVKTPFIRPVNFVTILLDSHVVSGCVFNKSIGRVVYGLRSIRDNQIILNHAEDYPEILLKQGCVIADYDLRKDTIRLAIEKKADSLGGCVDLKDNILLEKITASIEWPVVLFGRFDKKFLILPEELILHIMKNIQQYFPVYDSTTGMLLPCFIFVVNVVTNNYDRIIVGHENVIRSRFIDAEFYLKNDSKYRLEDYIPKLNSVMFHNKLGSLLEKVGRISKLSGWIANKVNLDVNQAKRASYLCKCDLMTDVVLEFPELQGIMGMYYARRDGELESIALAQKEHYQPKYNSDVLPEHPISCVISIADKMDTISGIFGIQEFPTGSRDPFGLKRAIISVLNIIIQKKISLNLLDLIHQSVILYKKKLIDVKETENHIYSFLYKRLCLYYCALGYKLKIVKSVLNSNCFNLVECDIRINVIDNFYKTRKEDSYVLNLLYKRIFNILKKQNLNMFNNSSVGINVNLFIVPEEMQLFENIVNVQSKLQSVLKQNCYLFALNMIVDLSREANRFLDNVVVMNTNKDIQRNRLILLNTVKELILEVINISYVLS